MTSATRSIDRFGRRILAGSGWLRLAAGTSIPRRNSRRELRRTFLLCALLDVLAGCISGSTSGPCPEDLRPLSWYEEHGFGEGSVWFRDAVIYVPHEGSASITPSEVLSGPKELLTPMHVVSETGTDCPGTDGTSEDVDQNRLSLVAGRGRVREDGVFAVECVCRVEKIEGLTAEQVGRLYAGPRPR
jgi:hypothetical protein